jgi:hypothetical protein
LVIWQGTPISMPIIWFYIGNRLVILSLFHVILLFLNKAYFLTGSIRRHIAVNVLIDLNSD